MSNLTTQPRIFLAAGAIAVAWACWRALERKSARHLYIAFAILGLVAGFRPDLLAMLFPLAAITAWRCGARWRTGALCIAAMLASVAAWLWIPVSATGGMRQFLTVLRYYSEAQFQTSAAFGAGPVTAAALASKAFVWTCAGAIAWIWAAPRFRASMFPSPIRRLLLAWILPAFLFHTLIHIGDPDHALVAVPALCLLGGRLLAEFRRPSIATAAAVALSCALFFARLPGIAGAATYRSVLDAHAAAASWLDPMRSLASETPVIAVTPAGPGGWRHGVLYVPEARILVVPGTIQNPGDLRFAMFYHRRNRTVPQSPILLPAGVRAVVIEGDRESLKATGSAPLSCGPFLCFTPLPGSRFHLAGYEFAVSGPPHPQ